MLLSAALRLLPRQAHPAAPFPSLFSRLLTPSTAFAPAPPVRTFSSSSPASLARKPTKIKLKTHKGAAKRWYALASGAFKRAKAGRVHKLSTKSHQRLQRLGEPAYARPAEKRILRRLMPYA
ncbi:hypothetical protein JCM21900_003022 [Sporobolomyces salmonicolor]